MSVLTAVGLAGFAAYLTNYILLVLQHVDGNGRRYQAVNLLAASLTLVSLSATFHMPSAMTQTAWIVLSVVGLAKRRNRHGWGQTPTVTSGARSLGPAQDGVLADAA